MLTGLAAGAHRSRAPVGLLSLPAAAQGPVSAALGRDQGAYHIRGLVAHNPAQRLAARFGRAGVAILAGRTRFAVTLQAFGRAGTLRPLAAVSPVASSDRVSYARGPVREWWANGPLGLEQGFDIARRATGSGALTLSLAVSGSVRLDKGAVLLPGGLRYTGVRATDARGRNLRAWLQVRGGRILVRVADRGARYPLRIDPTVQLAELTPSDGVSLDGPSDQFGYSVATSGNTVVVGAPYHAANSQAYSGAVYVFQMPAAGWASATQTAELSDSTLGANRELGFSVAISSDGGTIAAGAPAGSEAPGQEHVNPCSLLPCSQGTVDVFTTTTGNWTNTSAPNARLTVAGPESSLGGELGWSVGISGSTIVAGAPYDAGNPAYGEAYVFNEPPGGWSGSVTQAAELSASNPSNPNGDEYFGWSVAISGNTIAVGAYHQGPSSGYADSGAVYAFTGPWSGTQTQTAELTASDTDGSDDLGWSVAVSGNTIVSGAWNHQVGANGGQGAAYVFVMPTTGPWVNATQTAELTASDGGAGDFLGLSVAISGNTIVAGAPSAMVGSNDDQGAVYEYTEPAGGWANTSAFAAKLTASDGDGSDGLGDSVAISGSTIVAGTPRHDAESSTADFGAAYVFGPGSVKTPPPPPAVAPTAVVTSISGGPAKITVKLSCPAGGAACAAVSLKAMVKEHLKGPKITAITAHKHKKVRTTTKQVVVASGGVTLSAGTKKTLTLRLNSTGRALLSKFGKLKAIVTASSGGKAIKTVTVTVLQPAKPKKKK